MKTHSLKIWLGVGLLGLVTVSAGRAPAQGAPVADPPVGGVCIYSKNNLLGRSLAIVTWLLSAIGWWRTNGV